MLEINVLKILKLKIITYEGRSSQTGTFNFTGIKRDANVAVLHAVVSGVSYYWQAAHMLRASPEIVNQDGRQQW